MSQQHQQHLVNLRLLDSHESVDDAINYRIQVLQAFGPEHELFAPGCVDLLNMLIDTNTLSKAMRAVQDDLSRRGGNASSIQKVNDCFSKALTAVLARAGLVAGGPTASSKHSSSLNPRAPPYSTTSPTATAGGRTVSTTVPALSSTNTTPEKSRSGAATPMTTGRSIAPGWGRKNIRLSRIPPGVDLHEVTMGVDKYSGNMISYSPRTGEAIVSFAVVTAQDMLRQGSVVVGDYVCTADDKIAPLAENVVKPVSDEDLVWDEPAKPQTNGQAVNEVKQQLEDLAISASEQELEEINNSNKSTSAKTEWNDLSANADQKENNGFEATTSKPQDNIEDPYAHPPGATEDKAFLGAADAEQTTKTESSLPVPPSSTAEAASGLDNLSFVNWKKGFKKPDVSKYRKEQPVSGPEQANGVLGNADDNTFGGDSWGADTTAVGGWDGAASPTYLIEHGLMAPLPDIEDDGVTFSITGTFPFNTNGVANGLSSRFGEDALALYQVPIEHERIGGFNFEKTVTYYARFRELCAPAYERQAICLEPKSGDGGNGWYINLDPVDAIAPNAYMIRDQPSLVGYVDY